MDQLYSVEGSSGDPDVALLCMMKGMDTPWFKKAKQIARDRGLLQVELAARMGVSQTAISNWLSGKRSPKPAELQRLAGVIGVSLNELFSDDAAYVTDRAEVEIISLLREMDEEQRETAMRLVKALSPTQTD